MKQSHEVINPHESAVLFNEHPHETQFSVYHKKVNGEDWEEATDEKTASYLLAPGIIKLAEAKIGAKVIRGKEDFHVSDFLGSTTVSRVSEGEYVNCLLIPKAVSYFYFKDNWKDEQPPLHVMIECQHKMELFDAQACLLAVLVDSHNLKLIQVLRSRRIGQAIRQQAAEFMQMVDNRQEPNPNYIKDVGTLKKLNADADENKTINLSDDEEVPIHLENWVAWDKEIKRLKGLKESAKQVIFSKAGTASHIEAGNFFVNTGMIADSPPKYVTITEEMVGTKVKTSNGRKGYRAFKITEDK